MVMKVLSQPVDLNNFLSLIVSSIWETPKNKTLKDIINLENIIKVYDNTTGNEIIKNEYFIFIPKEFYYVFELYNEAFNYKNKELIIPINTNDKRNPEWNNITFDPLFRIEINNGYLFITKLLDNVTIQED